jgi:hypothetical protein
LKSRVPVTIAVTLMLAQVALIAYSRTTPARYFCWAPFDMQTDYALDVKLNGAPLTPEQIKQRYRLPSEGTDNRSVQNLIDRVQLYEERLATQKAEITMRYRINGKAEQIWHYLPQPE